MGTVQSPSRLKILQEKAWDEYQALPWPTRKDEEWRRTDPALFKLENSDRPFEALETACPSVGWEPPVPASIHSGVILTDFSTALKQFPDLAEQFLFQSGWPEGYPKLTRLHQACANSGIFCYVPKDIHVETPLRTWIEPPSQGKAFFSHTVIVVESGAEVTLIDERRSSKNGGDSQISNEGVEIFVKEGGILRYIHLQRWGPQIKEFFTQRAILEENAQFLNVTVALGGSLTKANIETVLRGTGSRSDLLGVLFGTNRQHFDFHTLQDHEAPHTFSDLLYKSALRDNSKAIYTGLIRIRKEAQKSDAYQANRNLLLNPGAKADSIPMLEIKADDVRCTHGVAVGPIDPDQAFYLMSRGLTQEEAQRLIVEGFFDQVFGRIPLEELREELRAEVDQRLVDQRLEGREKQ